MTDIVERLLEEVARLKEDAERYRWVRYHTHAEADAQGRQEFVMRNPRPIGHIMGGSVAQHLDAAIDAARAAEGKA